MSTILNWELKKQINTQLYFSGKKYLNYTKKTQFCRTITISLKQGQAITSSGPITLSSRTHTTKWVSYTLL